MSSRGATFIAPLPGTPPVGMSATDGRLALGGIFGTTPQLVSGGGISQSGSNMQFTLAQSVFQLADVTNAAATAFLPTDSIVLTPAAGPGTGSRIDLICIPLKNYENGDASSQSTPILVAGTAGSPGVAPAVPAGSYKYAQIAVPTSAATASACTVTIYGNTTFAHPSLNTPSAAALTLGSGVLNQKALSAADQITYRWNGSAWRAWESDWITYTPTLTGITLGTGPTTQFRYKYVNGDVWVDFSIRLGTGGAFTAQPTMTLPVTATALRYAAMTHPGIASAANAALNIFPIAVLANSSSTTVVTFWSTTTGAYTAVSPTAPITWALDSVLQGKFMVVPA